jgi:hypothetical protein
LEELKGTFLVQLSEEHTAVKKLNGPKSAPLLRQSMHEKRVLGYKLQLKK